MAYKILVFEEDNEQLSFLENSEVKGPLYEITIPYKRICYCSDTGIDYLVDDLGRRIICFISDTEYKSGKLSKIHRSYDLITEDEYEKLVYDRGFDYVEQEPYLYDM